MIQLPYKLKLDKIKSTYQTLVIDFHKPVYVK